MDDYVDSTLAFGGGVSTRYENYCILDQDDNILAVLENPKYHDYAVQTLLFMNTMYAQPRPITDNSLSVGVDAARILNQLFKNL